MKNLLSMIDGLKTYFGAAGLAAAGVLCFSEGQTTLGVSLFSLAVTVGGFRHALAKAIDFLQQVQSKLPPETSEKTEYKSPSMVTETLNPSKAK